MALRRPLVSVAGSLQELPSGDSASGTLIQVPHTWAIGGEIKVPVGEVGYIVPFFVPVPAGQTAVIARARHVIHAGTSVTLDVTKNGAGVTGFTGISVTTTAATTDPADVAIADNDLLALVVSAVVGTPKNMTFTLVIQYQPLAP